MVRLSLVNMYLHGFQNPHIYEYDTLTSEERWNEVFDVIIANPPFMTPKGVIRPHKRFSIQANKSEVLFVDYIAEHLNPNGRAGIIVPEGVIENNPVAYRNLRKMLVENYLYAVVSLPAGVFNPYSGVQTSILLLDKNLSKKTDKILFIKIENDGFDLGAQRRELKNSDLPNALKILNEYKLSIISGNKFNFGDSLIINSVTKKIMLDTENCNLSGDFYKETPINNKQKYEMVELGELLDYEQPTDYIVNSIDYSNEYDTPVLTAGKTFILGYTNEKQGIFKENLPVIIFDDFTTAIKYVDFPFKVKSSAMKILIPKKNKVNIKFLFKIMENIDFQIRKHKRHWISEYSKIKVPLPSLENQNKILKEMENYQNETEEYKRKISLNEQKIKKIINEVWAEKI
jgi:type I restriction enzyme M protein